MPFQRKRTARERKLLQFQLLVYNNKVRGVIPFQSGHTTSPLFSFNLVWNYPAQHLAGTHQTLTSNAFSAE